MSGIGPFLMTESLSPSPASPARLGRQRAIAEEPSVAGGCKSRCLRRHCWAHILLGAPDCQATG